MIGDCDNCGHSVIYHVPVAGCLKCKCTEFNICIAPGSFVIAGWMLASCKPCLEYETQTVPETRCVATFPMSMGNNQTMPFCVAYETVNVERRVCVKEAP